MNIEIEQLADEIRKKYGKEIREILFFGSRSRGDASPESDYDCLLVFREVTEDLKRDLDHLAAKWLLDDGIVFSWIAISESDLERLHYEPFFRNARREGIAA
jgi:predicted nucleotidyltransferase